jgi:hypothetical protein
MPRAAHWTEPSNREWYALTEGETTFLKDTTHLLPEGWQAVSWVHPDPAELTLEVRAIGRGSRWGAEWFDRRIYRFGYSGAICTATASHWFPLTTTSTTAGH